MPELTKEELLRIIAAQQEELKRKEDEYNQKLKKQDEKISLLERNFADLQEKYNKVLKQLYEKLHVIKVNNHNKFYSTKETAFNLEHKEDKTSPINEVEVNLSKKKGRPTGSKNFSSIDLESMVKETVTLDVANELIKNGWTLTKIGEDVSYLIKVERNIKVIKVLTPKYIRNDIKDEKIYQAVKDDLFPHSVCTASLSADIINAKYNLDVPLYRYAKYLNSQGIPLSDMDLTNYVKRTDEILNPLYELIKEKLINQTANVIHSDETPIEVLDYLRKENRKNGYIFAYVSSFYNNPIYLYDFNKTRETDKTQSMLDGYKGYVVADGYTGYNELSNKGIKIQRCFAHIRRKFYDIVKVLPDEQKKISVANEMVKRIDKLFAIEAQLKAESKTPLEIGKARKTEKYSKITEDIYSYLDSINAEEGTPLYAAVKYFKNIREESRTFLEDGHIPISNNICERAIKPFAIMRRNVLFAKTENGAALSGRIFTIVQTAKANGLIVDKYIEYVLENIKNVPLDDLLPWSERLPKELSIKQYIN